MQKSTTHLEGMVKRALAAGIKAKYILMDSWFGMPATISKLAKHLDVICMVKKQSNLSLMQSLMPHCNA